MIKPSSKIKKRITQALKDRDATFVRLEVCEGTNGQVTAHFQKDDWPMHVVSKTGALVDGVLTDDGATSIIDAFDAMLPPDPESP